MPKTKAFTLIELLVVIAIIGILAGLIILGFNSVRRKARDAGRLSDIKQLQTQLEFYFDDNGQYPISDNDGCGTWDVGNRDYAFMQNLTGINAPEDSSATGNCAGYFYYRYNAGENGCDASKGAYYVLGVADMETSGRPHPQSPGWSCPTRNWQNEFDWVMGKYENVD